MPTLAAMRFLFATGRTYLPDRHGGGQSYVHVLLRELARRGHRVEALAFKNPKASALRRALPSDRRNGYRTHRVWYEHMFDALSRLYPRVDVVLTQFEHSLEVAAHVPPTMPVVMFAHDTQSEWPRGALHSNVRVVACSWCVAQHVERQSGVRASVLHPPVERRRVVARKRRPERVLHVNPIEKKGVEVSLEVAKLLPDVPFTFLESWPLGARLDALRARVPANVEVLRARRRIAPVYGRAKILIAPSQIDEGFGMVALEAQANGIPVIASDRGGLPEAVGRGGVLLPHDAPASAWADAVREVLDPPAYERMSGAALENAAQPHLSPEGFTARFLEILDATRPANLIASA